MGILNHRSEMGETRFKFLWILKTQYECVSGIFKVFRRNQFQSAAQFEFIYFIFKYTLGFCAGNRRLCKCDRIFSAFCLRSIFVLFKFSCKYSSWITRFMGVSSRFAISFTNVIISRCRFKPSFNCSNMATKSTSASGSSPLNSRAMGREMVSERMQL